MNILNKILNTKKVEIEQAKALRGLDDIEAEARSVSRPAVSLSKALAGSATGIIAEFKRRSPSKGFINQGADVETVVGGYAANGAAAISVLTDGEYFAGSLDDLRTARRTTAIPLLRKEFVVDPYQICQARIAGADAILLIAAALTVPQCRALAAYAASLGLEVLLELHGESELEFLDAHVDVVGVNNRNLNDFVTDIGVSKRLAGLLPRDVVRISESGLSTPQAVRELREEGYNGFLMGENFMKTEDPAATLGRFIKELER